jgi:flagellar basal-body rod modification protein FlgD
MSQIPSVNSTTENQTFGAASALNEVDLDDFLNLMIAELQNQDPLNPLDNADLLAQISQIREVGATEQLTSTLNAVLLGQNITSATNLIGADVVALNDNGQRVSGNVKVVTITDGQPMLDIAIDPSAAVAETDGEVEEGRYIYEVVWESDQGTMFGVEIGASSEGVSGFEGAIQLSNLPETSGQKSIYRTDKTGDGERKLVGVLPQGSSNTFVDTKSDDQREGDPLTAKVQLVEFASRERVTLNNVGEIRPPAG